MRTIDRTLPTVLLLPTFLCLLVASTACESEPKPLGGPVAVADHEAEPEGTAAEARVHVSPDSDPRAIEIAQSVMEKLGGQEGWDDTRFLSWKFFARRMHHWDRYTGDVRIEGPSDDHEYLWLINVNTGDGRVWKDGEELPAGDELDAALDKGRQIWVNDSYWLVMPYKLLDPGVTLRYAGEREMEDGRTADVLELTFGEGVGYTPKNRYEVFVARDTGLVEQWSFYRDAADAEPGFTGPWLGWQRFGKIMLATGRGRDADWEIAVHDALPRSTFTEP